MAALMCVPCQGHFYFGVPVLVFRFFRQFRVVVYWKLCCICLISYIFHLFDQRLTLCFFTAFLSSVPDITMLMGVKNERVVVFANAGKPNCNLLVCIL